MQVIYTGMFGSRLFGVSTPESDTDIKGVHALGLDDLLWGRNETFQACQGEGPNKVESESHSISKFAGMIRTGQPIAFTLLCTPEEYWNYSTPAWEELIENRSRLLSKTVTPFIGYARSQAVKYSLKGKRLTTLRKFIERLEGGKTFEELRSEFEGMEGIRLWVENLPNGEQIRHIEVCGKSFGETTATALWLGPLKKLESKYGVRAETASMEPADWKAMYHAVRLSCEVMELLDTGVITYPRPEAEILKLIRRGGMSQAAVSLMIDKFAENIDHAIASSTLPERCDWEWLSDWVVRTQRDYL